MSGRHTATPWAVNSEGHIFAELKPYTGNLIATVDRFHTPVSEAAANGHLIMMAVNAIAAMAARQNMEAAELAERILAWEPTAASPSTEGERAT